MSRFNHVFIKSRVPYAVGRRPSYAVDMPVDTSAIVKEWAKTPAVAPEQLFQGLVDAVGTDDERAESARLLAAPRTASTVAKIDDLSRAILLRLQLEATEAGETLDQVHPPEDELMDAMVDFAQAMFANEKDLDIDISADQFKTFLSEWRDIVIQGGDEEEQVPYAVGGLLEVSATGPKTGLDPGDEKKSTSISGRGIRVGAYRFLQHAKRLVARVAQNPPAWVKSLGKLVKVCAKGGTKIAASVYGGHKVVEAVLMAERGELIEASGAALTAFWETVTDPVQYWRVYLWMRDLFAVWTRFAGLGLLSLDPRYLEVKTLDNMLDYVDQVKPDMFAWDTEFQAAFPALSPTSVEATSLQLLRETYPQSTRVDTSFFESILRLRRGLATVHVRPFRSTLVLIRCPQRANLLLQVFDAAWAFFLVDRDEKEEAIEEKKGAPYAVGHSGPGRRNYKHLLRLTLRTAARKGLPLAIFAYFVGLGPLQTLATLIGTSFAVRLGRAVAPGSTLPPTFLAVGRALTTWRNPAVFLAPTLWLAMQWFFPRFVERALDHLNPLERLTPTWSQRRRNLAHRILVRSTLVLASVAFWDDWPSLEELQAGKQPRSLVYAMLQAMNVFARPAIVRGEVQRWEGDVWSLQNIHVQDWQFQEAQLSFTMLQMTLLSLAASRALAVLEGDLTDVEIPPLPEADPAWLSVASRCCRAKMAERQRSGGARAAEEKVDAAEAEVFDPAQRWSQEQAYAMAARLPEAGVAAELPPVRAPSVPAATTPPVRAAGAPQRAVGAAAAAAVAPPRLDVSGPGRRPVRRPIAAPASEEASYRGLFPRAPPTAPTAYGTR